MNNTTKKPLNQNKMVEKIMNKIDEDFYKENNYYLSITDPKSFAEKVAIEFAKMHIEKIMNLQQSKYYAGETGYITKEEWQDLLNVK